MSGELVHAGVIDRCERVVLNDGHHDGVGLGHLGNGAGGPFLDGVVGSDGEPWLDIVVGVDLGGETLVDILVTDDYTIVVQIVEREEEVTVIIAALEG